eukprot:SAG31_NODE_1016_length_10365_cov_16.138418_8_plen_111_part_00
MCADESTVGGRATLIGVEGNVVTDVLNKIGAKNQAYNATQATHAIEAAIAGHRAQDADAGSVLRSMELASVLFILGLLLFTLLRTCQPDLVDLRSGMPGKHEIPFLCDAH